MKIMTLNLNYYGTRHGSWQDRRELVAGLIGETAPDIIALQAVRRDPTVAGDTDQASQLARLLPEYRHVYFQPAAHFPDGSEEGSAFLARVPFVETGCVALSLRPGLEDANHRALLWAQFDFEAGGQELIVYNAHFSWVLPQARDNLAESMLQLQALAGPALLVGDMNTTPDSDLWEPLQAAGWRDVWATLRAREPGFTFESDRLFMRIDYAWANEALLGRVKAIDVLARERPGVRLSDHLGLAVTL